jgi:hypothetical protein
MLVLIKDELFTGKLTNELAIDFQVEIVSIQEIITQRVIAEVENYNLKLPEYFHGLVEPLDSEKTLHGYKLKKKQLIDEEKQVYVALDAFQKNGFFILIDNIQAENLDQQVLLKPTTSISFVKLTPLVGG